MHSGHKELFSRKELFVGLFLNQFLRMIPQKIPNFIHLHRIYYEFFGGATPCPPGGQMCLWTTPTQMLISEAYFRSGLHERDRNKS